MKLSVLSRYGRRGASSRLRMWQYLPWLEEAGAETEAGAFWRDDYLDALYAGRTARRDWLRALPRRRAQLRAARGSDAIWLQGEAFPWLPWGAERGAWPRGVPVAADYDDAIFHRYDMHRSRAARAVMGGKIDRVMARADLVTAGNAYLADRARAAGAARVEIVPTVVDLARYDPSPLPDTDGRPRLGWIGTPQTWEAFGGAVIEATRALRAEGARLLAVGARMAAADEDGIEYRPWSEAGEIDLLRRMDVGLMPLADTPWARGKCGYKLIQYMACAIPVVASPVGANVGIVDDAESGVLADGPGAWTEALRTLLGDGALRRRMGRAGRARVERDFSLQSWGPRVAGLLRDVAA